MDATYDHIKNTPIYKTIQKNLQEVSKKYLECVHKPLTEKSLLHFNTSLNALLQSLGPIQESEVVNHMKSMIKEDFVISVNFYTPSPLSKQYRPFPGEEPEVFYSLQNTATLRPHICPHSNGLDIPLQQDEIFRPLELKKVNLMIKFLLPKNHCALLMNKSSARTKYNVNVQLGLIDVGYHNYVQAVIQNMTDQEIILKKGTAVAQLLLIPAKIPNFTYNEFTENSERGSFGSTGQSFEEILTPKTSPFTIKETKLSHQHYLDVEDRLGPRQISINFIPIHLLDSPHERAIQVFELQNFENSLLEKISPNIMKILPVYQCQNSSEETQISKEEPTLSENDLSLLLAADLATNKKLSLSTLIYMQTMDPLITSIKEDLVGSKNLKSFILHRGVVFKIFNKTNSDQQRRVIYVPSTLLYPICVYVHKYFLHPSRSQTYIQFNQLYYHPNSRRAIQKICNACVTCAASRNVEYKNTPLGKERTVDPLNPREAISIDIIYLPKSSRGHTHALLIADLYSLYLSFIPMKSKSSDAVVTALRQYISFMGVPITIYSDNDQAFRGETQTLINSYNIQHITSYPYTQKNNTVEASVRKFLNAARSAIIECPVAKHTEWHTLYPLIIIRLNTLISKYGLSREYVHFQNILDSHLPLIVDVKLDADIENDLDDASHKFRGAIQKFLKNKKKQKSYYKTNEKFQFTLHELVMRKEYTPASSLHPTYLGPYRIMELYSKGASIKDPRTGDTMSVHFQNLRKISISEFIQLLPTHFDADIMKNLNIYRYNKIGQPEKGPSISDHHIDDNVIEDERNPIDVDEFSPDAAKILRSGRRINVNVCSLPDKYHTVKKAQWSSIPIPHQPLLRKDYKNINRIHEITTLHTAYYKPEQEERSDIFMFQTSLETVVHHIRPEKNYKTRYRSSFSSDRRGILFIELDNIETSAERVRFSHLEVKFY